jgi:hypothetical protein
MSNTPSQHVPAPSDSGNPDRADRYADLAFEADAKLDQQLANIRKDVDEGTISLREAADERVLVMQEHLDRLALLRAEYLPGSG